MKRAFLNLLLGLTLTLPALGAGPVDAILARLDRFNQTMKTFRSDIQQRKFIKILGEFDDTEEGEICMKKTPQGVLLKKVLGKPGHTYLTVRGNDMILFYPRKNQAMRRKLTEKETGFANLGVSMSTAEMKKNFEIRHVRDEALDGRPCNVIQLIPKTAGMKSYFASLYLWLAINDGTPLQQRIDEPGGDYTVIRFLNIRLNLDVRDSTFDLKLPRNVEYIS